MNFTPFLPNFSKNSAIFPNATQGKLINDLNLNATSDWTDIFEKINELIANRQILGYLDNCKYTELFNDKVMAVYGKREFINSVESYISNLNSLLENNPILNERFTEQNAETLGKELAKHNLFDAHHTIRLKDGVTEIHSLEEWNAVVNTQLERLYTAPELSTIFQKLKRMLTANGEVSRLRDIIIAHREIIPALRNISTLKVQTWLDCFSKLDVPFADYENELALLSELSDTEKYELLCQIGYCCDIIRTNFGENSKWKWAFLDTDSRFAILAKNMFDLRRYQKLDNPMEDGYKVRRAHIALVQKVLIQVSLRYREKYELSGKEPGDLKRAIDFQCALHRIVSILGDPEKVENSKKQIDVWKLLLDKHFADEDAKKKLHK